MSGTRVVYGVCNCKGFVYFYIKDGCNRDGNTLLPH